MKKIFTEEEAKSFFESVHKQMLERGKSPINDDDIIIFGDSIGYLLPNGLLYEQFACGNARGRTGKEGKEKWSQFYRKFDT